MPELPEVETTRRGVAPHVERQKVTAVRVYDRRLRWPVPRDLARRLVGRTVDRVDRRSKYLLFRLGADTLLVHMGMTGSLRVFTQPPPKQPHDHVDLEFDNGIVLRYRDPRRFGRLLLGTEQALLSSKKMPRLGPEPIDPGFAPDELYRRLRKRRAAIKAVLLDQGAIAGVGNIYADESLHKARLRPDRIAGSLSKKSARRLHESLRESLTLAIANRGSSVDTYRDAWGEIGGQQEKLLVYGRAGEPCFTCGRPLSAIRIAGRTTVFCRRCQR